MHNASARFSQHGNMRAVSQYMVKKTGVILIWKSNSDIYLQFKRNVLIYFYVTHIRRSDLCDIMYWFEEQGPGLSEKLFSSNLQDMASL